MHYPYFFALRQVAQPELWKINCDRTHTVHTHFSSLPSSSVFTLAPDSISLINPGRVYSHPHQFTVWWISLQQEYNIIMMYFASRSRETKMKYRVGCLCPFCLPMLSTKLILVCVCSLLWIVAVHCVCLKRKCSRSESFHNHNQTADIYVSTDLYKCLTVSVYFCIFVWECILNVLASFLFWRSWGCIGSNQIITWPRMDTEPCLPVTLGVLEKEISLHFPVCKVSSNKHLKDV